MAVKPHLVPTEIVDKNGRRTVVYRKPLVSEAKHKASLRPNKYSIMKRRSIVDDIEQLMHVHPDDRPDPSIRYSMMQYPDQLLDRLLMAYRERKPNLWVVMVHIRNGEPSGVVSEALHFYPMLAGNMGRDAMDIVRSLHGYRQLPVSDDYIQESAEVILRAESLVKVIDAVITSVGYYGVFREDTLKCVFMDDYFTDFVLSHFDQVDRIVEIINERKTIDRLTINDILQASSVPLGSGVL